MKKLISVLLVVMILFNFTFCRNTVYADPDSMQSKNTGFQSEAKPSNSITQDIVEDGSVSTSNKDGAKKESVGFNSAGLSAVGAVTGIIAIIINIIVVQIDLIISILTMTDESVSGTADSQFWFSIDRTVFNRISLFNVNYFNTENYEVGDITVTANSSNTAIKQSVSKVYYITRMLALILSLLVLIYIGIRMALSTVAYDQAKYKKMFLSWVESLVLIFVMPYIMIAISTFGDFITNIFFKVREAFVGSGTVFEETIHNEVWLTIFAKSGLDLTLWSIIYWCLLFLEIKFFWLYIKRFLMVGLLIAVSPLITITYSIDKAGDGRAQVFSKWTQEYLINILIQPLHALIYLVFVVTANSIAERSPLIALALLLAMGAVERMVKVIFNMSITTLRGVDKFMKKG